MGRPDGGLLELVPGFVPAVDFLCQFSHMNFLKDPPPFLTTNPTLTYKEYKKSGTYFQINV